MFGSPGSEVGGSQSFEDLQYHPVQFGDQRVWQGEAMANRPRSAEIHGGLWAIRGSLGIGQKKSHGFSGGISLTQKDPKSLNLAKWTPCIDVLHGSSI